jgi:hypothetical protein
MNTNVMAIEERRGKWIWRSGVVEQTTILVLIELSLLAALAGVAAAAVFEQTVGVPGTRGVAPPDVCACWQPGREVASGPMQAKVKVALAETQVTLPEDDMPQAAPRRIFEPHCVAGTWCWLLDRFSNLRSANATGVYALAAGDFQIAPRMKLAYPKARME